MIIPHLEITLIACMFQLLSERGEKLAGLGDRTEEMAMQAQAYSDAAHQLMLKYKDKKWYQF